MASFIQISTAILIVVGIVVGGMIIYLITKLLPILNSVTKTLEDTRKNIEDSVAEVKNTLARVETIAQTTEVLLREEVGPTLQVARETLSHVEVTTRALADATTAARRIAGKAEQFVDKGRLIAAGGVVAKKGAGLAGSLLSGLGHGVLGLFGHRPKAEPSPTPAPGKGPQRPALPDKPPAEEILMEQQDVPAQSKTKARK